MRRFAGVGMISDRLPGKTTILAFRHLLKKRREREQIFATVKDHLKKRDMARKQGTIIDASLIAVPSSTLAEARG